MHLPQCLPHWTVARHPYPHYPWSSCGARHMIRYVGEQMLSNWT
uniref:Uncharacterized protein n=1 Tax=Arundo donax TaxID=35708 RepID=A0A0A9HEL4_ARUDO